MASLNAVGFLASNEIHPNLIFSCKEIELSRDKVAEVASDHFRKDSCNLKRVWEGTVRDGNPEVAKVFITSDNFENRHLLMEEGNSSLEVVTVPVVSDGFKNMHPSHLQEALIEAVKGGDLETVKVIIVASNDLKDMYFSHLRRVLIEAVKNGYIEIVESIIYSIDFKLRIYNMEIFNKKTL